MAIDLDAIHRRQARLALIDAVWDTPDLKRGMVRERGRLQDEQWEAVSDLLAEVNRLEREYAILQAELDTITRYGQADTEGAPSDE